MLHVDGGALGCGQKIHGGAQMKTGGAPSLRFAALEAVKNFRS